MSPIKVTWRLAWRIILQHSAISYRCTALFAVSALILLVGWEYYSQSSILIELWAEKRVWLIVPLVVFHFGPANIYAVKKIFNRHQPALMCRLMAVMGDAPDQRELR